MEKVISVVFCGGWRFSTREKEIEVIKNALTSRDVDIEKKFDFSNSSFEFIHDDENNAVLANYEGDGGTTGYWNTMDYRIRSHFRSIDNVIFNTQKGTYGFETAANKLMKF